MAVEQAAHKNITMQTVAEHCGVSSMTVSRALRRDPRVAPETAERILEAACRLGYDPARNQMARQMALRKHGKTTLNRAVGIFFPPLFYESGPSHYFNPIYHGIMHVMMMERFALVTNYISFPRSVNPDDGYDLLDALPSIYSHGDIDGVIMFGMKHEQEFIRDLLQDEVSFKDRPIVTLIEPVEGCSCVITDDYPSAYAAASHLLELGHRHLVHFCNEKNNFHVWLQRANGYRQAYRDRGLDPEKYLHCLEWDVDFHARDVEEFCRFIRAHREVTGILGLQDDMAQELAGLLAQTGLRVPEDISLIGHDDSEPLLDSNGENILTTVRVPLMEIGLEAAKLILQCVQGVVMEDKQVILPTTLVVRKSTATPTQR